MSNPFDPPVASTWHRVDVCRRDSLAQTRVRVIGALDAGAIREIDRAVESATARGDSLSLDLGQLSSVSPRVLHDLLTRGRLPRVAFAA